ncbi:signal transduction histidine kinase [Pseudoclavibacter chungangensis]|uniref:sensor histidine kinase n=1 Tax=Pseudoclavibacter chungangensis TaxID=587635 RepID=UPI0015C8192A|nr:sensor histidine kinase [Pseudoclavibacter chungangensis]NYJ66413.1 signal transduction histidine kinase [Pseudoclavibacter chungangensis]
MKQWFDRDGRDGAVEARRHGTTRRDVALAVLVTLVLAAVIALSAAGSRTAPPPLAFVFALGFGAVLLARRRFPVLVLAVSVLATFGYYTLGLPTIGVALPVVAALGSAAERGRTAWAIGAGVLVFLVALAFRLRDDPLPLGALLGPDAMSNIALLAAGIAIGALVRERRTGRAQQRRIALLRQEQAERESAARVQLEREELSRELHDTIGHALSVIALHAGVGAESLGRDGSAAEAAFDRIRTQSTASLDELRTMVRVLRSGGGPSPERRIASLADAPLLVERARATGLAVEASIDLDGAVLTSGVEAAAYRVLQESLTNVLRHACASRVEVRVRVEDRGLVVLVADDGRGPTDEGDDGFGVVGMTERVRLLGGSLTTRRGTDGGTVVEARLPSAPHGDDA